MWGKEVCVKSVSKGERGMRKKRRRVEGINRTNIIHMTTSVSRKLDTLCIMFKIIAVIRITLFVRLLDIYVYIT